MEAQMQNVIEASLIDERRKPRFEPYGGAGPVPTDCCEFAVVDHQKGIEVCRVWEEEDARTIAALLEKNRDS
jgi:hypothetical protein